MNRADENFRREDLKRGMRQVFDQTLDERVERYLEVAHQGLQHTLRQHPTGAALAAVDECHNELCVLQELLEQRERPFSLVEYEPALPDTDQRIDFRATNDVATWFVEVKTIHPELKDRWEAKLPFVVGAPEGIGGGGVREARAGRAPAFPTATLDEAVPVEQRHVRC